MNPRANRLTPVCIAPWCLPELSMRLQEGRPTSAPAQPRFGSRIATIEITDSLLPWDYARIRLEALAALNSSSIEQVILRVDSPGGVSEGCEETSLLLHRLSKAKPVIAVCDGYCTSGAYWLASQARQIMATPSTMIGSCGVRSLLVDASLAFELEGYRIHHISTAEAKLVGAMGKPVTESDIARVKAMLHAIEVQFLQAVKRRRQMNADQRGELFDAEVYLAADAKKRGFIDEVAIIEDKLAEIHENSEPTFGNLSGAAAVEKFEELVCKAGKVKYADDANAKTISKIEKRFPELATAVRQEEERAEYERLRH